MVYAYKPKSFISTPAQVAGEVCENLANDGGLTPKRLVDVSRPEDAPLHKEFEWNDTVAAEAYRETQASHIIRCLIVRPEETVKEPTRAFVRVEEGTRAYTPIKVVLKSQAMTDVLLQRAMRDMEIFCTKYDGLSELVNVVKAMREALKNQEAA